MREFVDAWAPLFRKHDVRLYVVWDLDRVPSGVKGYAPVHEMCREHVPGFIPTGTDMIRSWGMYEAWVDGSPYILTLDDDVRPSATKIDTFTALEREFEKGSVSSRFLSVGALTTGDQQMRGFPYRDRAKAKVAIQYGGWNRVLDYDAATQLSAQPDTELFRLAVVPVPRGVPVTTCIMNAAWRREYTPIMWQLPMLDGKYNRFGDIWSGLFQKRVLDILGDVMLINGFASVEHERASDPFTNLERELPGLRINETLADVVFDPALVVGHDTLANVYRYVTDWASAIFPHEYRTHFQWARDQWLELFA